MADFSKLNGYNVKDAQARQDIETLKEEKLGFKRRLTSSDDLNKMYGPEYTGIYTYNTGDIPQNCPFQNGGTIEIVGTNTNGTRQTVTRYGVTAQSKTRIYYNSSWQAWNDFGLLVEDETYSGCYYRMVNNVKQWENPPLVTGVEYATTRRHNGKVVYVKHLDLGQLPSSGQKNTTFIATGNGGRVIKHQGFCTTGSGTYNTFPFFTASGELRAKISFSEWSVMVHAITDSSANTGECTVWYIKL